jgi:hypothetical protein
MGRNFILPSTELEYCTGTTRFFHQPIFDLVAPVLSYNWLSKLIMVNQYSRELTSQAMHTKHIDSIFFFRSKNKNDLKITSEDLVNKQFSKLVEEIYFCAGGK